MADFRDELATVFSMASFLGSFGVRLDRRQGDVDAMRGCLYFVRILARERIEKQS